MKKFLVFAAIFAAAVMTVSCGGSTVDGVTYENGGDRVCGEFWRDGQCKGHDVKVCSEGNKSWYEVEGTGKKFACDSDDDCTKAAYDLSNYCFDTNIDYEEEDGTTCVTNTDPDTCGGKPVKTCTKDDSYWYEVDGKKFECKDASTENEECTQAVLDFTKYCSEAEENAENGEGNEGGESEFTTEPTAYLPEAYADKTLDAWYALTDANEDKIKIVAVFLFNDKTLVVTSSKVYSAADGRPVEDEIDAEGTFKIISGDYDNGTAHVVAGDEFDVIISDGVLSAMGDEFIKQDNADAPEAR